MAFALYPKETLFIFHDRDDGLKTINAFIKCVAILIIAIVLLAPQKYFNSQSYALQACIGTLLFTYMLNGAC